MILLLVALNGLSENNWKCFWTDEIVRINQKLHLHKMISISAHHVVFPGARFLLLVGQP